MKKHIGQPHMIKRVNKNLITDLIKEQGPISKPEIADITKLSLPTVNKTVESLLQKNIIEVAGKGESRGGGRKPYIYQFNEDSALIIALFLKDQVIEGVMASSLGNIRQKEGLECSYINKDDTLNTIYRLIDNLMSKKRGSTKVKAIGMGVPGVVDAYGVVYNIPNINGWEGIHLKEILMNKYKLPIYIENDVNLTAYGVYHGEFEKQYSNLVYAYFGSGTGLGIIINSDLYKGANNFAGEISYMVTENVKKEFMLKVKNKGLFEHKVSELVNEIVLDNSFHYSEEITKLEINDPKLQVLLYKVISGLINIISLLDPEVIVVKGQFINKQFLEEAKNIVYQYIKLEKNPQIKLLANEDAGLVGTINFCLSRINSGFSLVNNKGV